MSAPVVGIRTRDSRIAITFRREGKLEGWVYLDELSYETRDWILSILETQETRKAGQTDRETVGQESDNDPFARARCRSVARMIVARKLGLKAERIRSRNDGSPYLVLRVPEATPQNKRIEDWLTIYFSGVEVEKKLYGSYSGDGSGEITDLAHEFHLGKNRSAGS